jgi:hypothetical protein
MKNKISPTLKQLSRKKYKIIESNDKLKLYKVIDDWFNHRNYPDRKFKELINSIIKFFEGG